jgi:2-polyprenyl-3-methyl-5-hydroxy-6-metoxy-1,4-benzoquinol methylase
MGQSEAPPKQETGEVYITSNIVIKKIAGRLTKNIKRILQEFKADQLIGLDIGCAEGHLLAELKDKGIIKKIITVELEYSKIVSSVLNKSECLFVQGDASCIGLQTGTFDYVLATEVLEHLPHPEKALAEICRVAKKEAFVVISVPYEPFFHIGNICRGKHLHRGGKTPSHLHFWNRNEVKALLSPFLKIEKEFSFATFPWLLYLCRNK